MTKGASRPAEKPPVRGATRAFLPATQSRRTGMSAVRRAASRFSNRLPWAACRGRRLANGGAHAPARQEAQEQSCKVVVGFSPRWPLQHPEPASPVPRAFALATRRGNPKSARPMSPRHPAFTPKPSARLDACEIFHKVVALLELKPDNEISPHFLRLMQTALPHSRSTPLD